MHKYQNIFLHRLWSPICLVLCCLILETSCKKYLDQKPLKASVVPSTLSDLQALLDNDNIMNAQSTPPLLEVVADNYYLRTEDWQGFSLDEQTNYIWAPSAEEINSWRQPYTGIIYYANLVLDALNKIAINGSNKDEWNSIKGSAIFYRSFGFYSIAQLYCKPYTSSAATDPGIVLKLSSDISESISRSTVQKTYDQIVIDLKQADTLLPLTSLISTRPNKAAVEGFLARVFLSMRDYSNAASYANLCLKKNDTLMDYNSVAAPFLVFNPETIYYSWPGLLNNIMFPPSTRIDSTLYNSYDNNDLRKSMFFSDNGDGTFSFNGSYTGQAPFFVFDGVATDEIYLIRAECEARANDKVGALEDLNTLLINRYRTNSFTPITAVDQHEALDKILSERRKELLFRGLRWTDIRRLNIEGYNITLKRVINGTTYILPPNDKRSVLLIPKQVLNLSPNLQQNLR